MYEDIENIHIITELCTGGELYDMVLDKAESEDGHFLEYDAAYLINDIVNAISYCHNKMNIVHRDLKPENFLLKDKDSNPLIVKIIDFGLSRKVLSGKFSIMETRVGSPYYVAPEVLVQNPHYNSKCDIWSIGIITYILLCGFPPFDGNNDYEILQAISNDKLEFPTPEWDNISKDAKDFVTMLLQRDVDKRYTAKDALQHPWLSQFNNNKVECTSTDTTSSGGVADNSTTTPSSSSQSSSSPAIPKIPKPMKFNRETSAEISFSLLECERRTAFQKLMANIKINKAFHTIALALSPSEAGHLGKIFDKVDQDHDGHISIKDIDDAVNAEGMCFPILTRVWNVMMCMERDLIP